MKKISFLMVAIVAFNGCGSSNSKHTLLDTVENNISDENNASKDVDANSSIGDSGISDLDSNTSTENNSSDTNITNVDRDSDSGYSSINSNSYYNGSTSLGNSSGNNNSGSTNSTGDTNSGGSNSTGDTNSGGSNSTGDTNSGGSNSTGDTNSGSTNSTGDTNSGSTNSTEDTNSDDNSNSTSSSTTSSSTTSSSTTTTTSSSSTSSSSSTTTTSSSSNDDEDSEILGKAVDGNLMNAFVFLDLNRDGEFSDGEPSSTTDKYGKYKFTLTSEQKKASTIGYAPIVVDGDRNITVDTATGLRFKGVLKSPLNLKNPPTDKVYTTPITTVLAYTIENNGSIDINTIDTIFNSAKSKVAKTLGLDDVDNLEADPTEDVTLMKLSLQIQKSIELATTLFKSTNNPYSELYKSFASNLSDDINKTFNSVIEKEDEFDINSKKLLQGKISKTIESASTLFEGINSIDNIIKLSIQFQTVVNYVSEGNLDFDINNIAKIDYTLEYNKNILSPYIDVIKLGDDNIKKLLGDGVPDLNTLTSITSNFEGFIEEQADFNIAAFKYEKIRTESKKTSDWDTGYCSSVDVLNSTSDDINWSVDMNITGEIYTSWNVKISDKKEFIDTNITTFKASGADWNSVVKAYDKVSFGYCAWKQFKDENTTEATELNNTTDENSTELTKLQIGEDTSDVDSYGYFGTIEKPVLVVNSFEEIDDKLSNFYDVSVDVRNSNLVKEGKKDINIAVILNRLDNKSDAQLLAIVPVTVDKRENDVVIVAKEDSAVTLVAKTGSGQMLSYSMTNYSENVKTTTTPDGVKRFTIKASTILNKFTQVSTHPQINQYIKDVIFNNLTTEHGYDVYILFSNNTFDEDTPIILNNTDEERDISEIMGITKDSDLDKNIVKIMGTDLKGYWGEVDLVK